MAHRPFHLMVYRGKIALEEQSNDFMLLWNLNEPVQVCSDNETFEMKKDDLFSLNPYENCTVQAKNGLLVAFLLDDAQLRDCFGGKNYRIRGRCCGFWQREVPIRKWNLGGCIMNLPFC